jgi:uncharacterized tellurite resistance protein B-like protein
MNETLKSHFLNLYAMALSDAQIETVELEALYKIGAEKGIERTQIDQIILNPDKVRFNFPETINEKIIYLYDLAKIIMADDIVDKNERSALEYFCARFGFRDENIVGISDFLIAAAKENMDQVTLLKIINENIN